MSFTCKRLFIGHQQTALVHLAFSFSHSMALVGQSGSGKSLTLKALLGMVSERLHVELDYEAPFVLKRGHSVAFVPQNPFTALSPLTRIGAQFFHPEAEKYLAMVGLDPAFLTRYPPELSGGQLQRVVIAMALSLGPKLVLMDEPTTALDAPTRERVLKMIAQLQETLGFLMLFVTHDIHSAALVCRDIAILHQGEIVEKGPMNSVLKAPASPHTRALLETGFANRGFRQ